MTQALEISLAQDDPLKHFVKQGNTGPSIRRALIDPETGLPINLTGAVALFVVTELDKTAKFNGAAVIEEPETAGIVRYDFTVGDTADVGVFLAEFQITLFEGQTLSYPPANADPERNFIRLQIAAGLNTEGD
jgi:hypothetical protein